MNNKACACFRLNSADDTWSYTNFSSSQNSEAEMMELNNEIKENELKKTKVRYLIENRYPYLIWDVCFKNLHILNSGE